jgi:hypothetical protein
MRALGAGSGVMTALAVSAITAMPTPAARQWVEMRHIDVRLADSATIRIRWLRGELLRTVASRPPDLGDPTTFRVRVTGGAASLTGADLGALANGVVFAYKGAPVRNVQIRIDSGALVQTGTVHKVVDFHFQSRATVELLPDGRVRMHPTTVRVLGLSAEKVLHTLGMHLSNVLVVPSGRGVSVDGDDVIIDPTSVLPPPVIEGRLRAVRIEGQLLVAEFRPTADDTLFRHSADSARGAPGFVAFHGGSLEIAHLEMHDADLRIADRDSLGSFDLSLPHYIDQLTHGVFTLSPALGVVARVPDFAALGMPPARGRLAQARR